MEQEEKEQEDWNEIDAGRDGAGPARNDKTRKRGGCIGYFPGLRTLIHVLLFFLFYFSTYYFFLSYSRNIYIYIKESPPVNAPSTVMDRERNFIRFFFFLLSFLFFLNSWVFRTGILSRSNVCSAAV